MSQTSRYFDLQNNGYGGIDFNAETDDALTAEKMQVAISALARDRNQAVLGTIITDTIDVMCHRLRRLVRLCDQDPAVKAMIPAFHIEGPFINPEPGYRGAHPVDAIHPADLDEMKQLLDAADGRVRVVTLAPECDPGLRVMRFLADQGITVSAGHCNPTLEVLDAAIDAGLSMWTHLGNGCLMQMHRHDNVIQRALSRADRLWLCFIADGVHVPFFALKNYMAIAGEKAIVVSDAMAAAGLGPGHHRIGRWEVEVGEDLAAWAPDRSHLIGSAMSMPQAQANLRDKLGLDAQTCHALLYERPLRAVGLQASLCA